MKIRLAFTYGLERIFAYQKGKTKVGFLTEIFPDSEDKVLPRSAFINETIYRDVKSISFEEGGDVDA